MNRESQLADIFVEVARALVVDFDLRDVLQLLVDRTAELVEATAVGILMTSQDAGLQMTASTSGGGVGRLEDFELVHREGPCFEAYAAGEQVSEPDLRDGERWPEFAQRALALGFRSVHGFPLWVRGEALGAFNVFFAEPGDFADSDVRALQALADVAALGIWQQRTSSRRRTRQQGAIAELGRDALSTLGDEVVLARVSATVREVLEVETATILELAADGGLVTRAVSSALPEAGGPRGARDVIEVASQALAEGRTVVAPAPEPADEPARGGSWPDHATAAAVVPGRDHDRDFGSLVVCCQPARRFDADDMAFLESAATLVASIVARHQVETRLRETQKLEAVGQLAGGVAHDFNNLLQIIHGNAELLARRSPGAELSEILVATEQGRGLVGRLLTFSRQQPATPDRFALNDVVAAVTQMLDRVVGDTVALVSDLAPDVAAVTVDKTQLEQAIINLVINARDAIPDGGRITISTGLAEREELPVGANGSFVRLSVADTGDGMTDDVLAQAFQPFFSTKPEGQGTGLGLATVYGAVTSAGGHVDVRTHLGRGTAVDLFLPHDPALPELSAVPPPEAQPTLEARVLVVEDRPEIRQLVTAALAQLGLTVRGADDAESALVVIAEDGPPDLLVTDLTLPGMQGAALAERVRAGHPALRVLFMSGYLAEGMDPGAGDAFLQKPFSLVRLAEEVRALLR